jgi:hypothetical protein
MMMIPRAGSPQNTAPLHTMLSTIEHHILFHSIWKLWEIYVIVQVSAEICCMTIVSEEGSETKDKATMVEREVNMFNKYVDPQKDAQYWDEFSIGVHNIRPTDKRIKDADFIGIIWDQFR